MTDLASLQQRFAAMLHGASPAGLSGPRSVAADSRLTAGAEAYRRNWLLNRAQALDDPYPVIQQVVGDDYFSALARAYAAVTPASSSDLNRYGATLAEFLTAFPPAAELPYLPDLARLEWAAHLAYYAADHPALTLADLAAVDPARWPALRLRLHPACALIASADWPIASIWQAQDSDDWPDLSAPWPEQAWVWRQDNRVWVRPLPVGHGQFVAALLAGATLEQAVAAINAEFDLQLSLSSLFNDQAIIAIA